jgi:hypothetical protein
MEITDRMKKSDVKKSPVSAAKSKSHTRIKDMKMDSYDSGHSSSI